MCAKMRSEEVYGDVCEFTTEAFALGKELNVWYQNGDFTGSGYFYTTVTSSIINGFGVPVLKSHMPEKLDALEFYVKSVDEEVQPLTAFVGYMTDPDKIATLTVIKSCTNNVNITKSYAKVTLPLSITFEELAIVPDDGIIYVGYYPPEGFNQKPLGCGYTKKTDAGFVETEGDKGIYMYWHVKNSKYVWAVSSSKAPRYVGFVTVE